MAKIAHCDPCNQLQKFFRTEVNINANIEALGAKPVWSKVWVCQICGSQAFIVKVPEKFRKNQIFLKIS